MCCYPPKQRQRTEANPSAGAPATCESRFTVRGGAKYQQMRKVTLGSRLAISI
jgi:hypothetical protein